MYLFHSTGESITGDIMYLFNSIGESITGDIMYLLHSAMKYYW
jgi:hypothetical protein